MQHDALWVTGIRRAASLSTKISAAFTSLQPPSYLIILRVACLANPHAGVRTLATACRRGKRGPGVLGGWFEVWRCHPNHVTLHAGEAEKSGRLRNWTDVVISVVRRRVYEKRTRGSDRINRAVFILV